MAMRARQGVGGLLALLLLLLPVLSASPAEAATGKVSLTSSGPDPVTLTVAKGDVVDFTNADDVAHTVTGTNGFRFGPVTVQPGAKRSTPPFAAVGTFTYEDAFPGVIIGTATMPGRVVVQAAAATPTPSTSVSAGPRPTATSPPTARPSAAGSAAPTPRTSASSAPVVAGGGGTAVLPGFTGGVTPLPAPSVPGGPAPSVADPPGSATPTPAGSTPVYADASSIAQPSSHRYGLPAALAVVGLVGIASLLVRFLLADPHARRRRMEALERPIVTLD